jgi:transcriptional antiterminator RfaH
MQAAWYVLQTNRYKEEFARVSLERRDIATYLPRIVQWPRPAVGSAIAPMFPGYLFARVSLLDDFSRFSWTPGVKAFVSFGDGPASIDDSAIEFLKRREGADGLIRCGTAFDDGGEVRIVNGPFRGLTGIVERRLPARERVCVLMELLHRQTRVELPERWIRQA